MYYLSLALYHVCMHGFIFAGLNTAREGSAPIEDGTEERPREDHDHDRDRHR
jgi:hypothetical protein